jgi:hypothetical protein
MESNGVHQSCVGSYAIKSLDMRFIVSVGFINARTLTIT